MRRGFMTIVLTMAIRVAGSDSIGASTGFKVVDGSYGETSDLIGALGGAVAIAKCGSSHRAAVVTHLVAIPHVCCLMGEDGGDRRERRGREC